MNNRLKREYRDKDNEAWVVMGGFVVIVFLLVLFKNC